MGSVLVLLGLILWSWLMWLAIQDRYRREFPPDEDEMPDWARDWLDEWKDL